VPSADNPDYVTGAGYNGPFEPQYDRLFIAPRITRWLPMQR
jgi:transketolase